jgi:hypothetical protein
MSTYKQNKKTKKRHIKTDSKKPKKWVGITNEPNCKFVIAHVHVLLLKCPTHLPCLLCLALVPVFRACSALPLLHFILPYPACPALPLATPKGQKQNPYPKP